MDNNPKPGRSRAQRKRAGQKTRERIIFEAFILFCTRQYDNVVYLDLEQATGLTRGAITYHFRDKHALFEAVIDSHWLRSKMSVLDIPLRGSAVLRSFIEDYTANCKRVQTALGARGIANVSKAYAILESSAFCFFDDFAARFLRMRQDEHVIWTRVIEQAIEQGEISLGASAGAPESAAAGVALTPRTLALLFMNLYTGTICASSKNETGCDIDQLRCELLALYDLVRS